MTFDDQDALVERLVRAGRADGPSARALQTAPLAVAALLSSTAAQAALVSAGSAALSPLALLKWVAVGSLVGASFMTVVHAPELFGRAAPQAAVPAPPVHAPAPAPLPNTAPLEAAPPAATVAMPSPSEGSARPAIRPDVAREVTLLDSARRDLVAGDAGGALRSLYALQRLPGRALVPEATLLEVRALLAQGRHAQARRIAEEFCAAAPSSPQAKILRQLVANIEIQRAPSRL